MTSSARESVIVCMMPAATIDASGSVMTSGRKQARPRRGNTTTPPAPTGAGPTANFTISVRDRIRHRRWYGSPVMKFDGRRGRGPVLPPAADNLAELSEKGVLSVLQGIQDANVPMLVTTGDADQAVPVTNTRMWVETMKALGMNYAYKEYPGVTHGPIIEAAMPDIFAFFKAHTRGAKK